jgi:hypothetical protein
LKAYSSILADKPKVFIFTKCDVFPKDEIPNIEGWFSISSATRMGIDEALREFTKLIGINEA